MTLSGEQLQQIARRPADSLPEVSNGRPFTETLDVYTVGDKVFRNVTDDPEDQMITVKDEPDRGSALRREHPTITRGISPWTPIDGKSSPSGWTAAARSHTSRSPGADRHR